MESAPGRPTTYHRRPPLESQDYQTVELPEPPPLEGMEDPANAPHEPFRSPEPVDLAAITVPAKP